MARVTVKFFAVVPLSSPPPLAREGQGGGMQQAPAYVFAPSPTLPRKRGREQAVQ